MKITAILGLGMLVVLPAGSRAGDAVPGGYMLVWADEFNKDGRPDPKNWTYERGFVRNQELQWYQPENAFCRGGRLILEGRRERRPNPAYREGAQEWHIKRASASYTSASLTTQGLHAWQYGRIEVRARLPQGRGMWPAIWTLGTNITQVGWPRCGEIDIMEYVGKQPHTIHATTHFADPKLKDRNVHVAAGGGKLTLMEPYKDFHVYAIEWDEAQIRFFVDDKPYAKLNVDAAGAGADNPFRKPHYLLLNLALGGNWGGEIDDGVLPQRYEIDYVRVFQKVRAK